MVSVQSAFVGGNDVGFEEARGQAAPAKENITASSIGTLQLSQRKCASRRLTACALARSFCFLQAHYRARQRARTYLFLLYILLPAPTEKGISLRCNPISL